MKTLKQPVVGSLREQLQEKAKSESIIRIELGLQKLPFPDSNKISIDGAIDVFRKRLEQKRKTANEDLDIALKDNENDDAEFLLHYRYVIDELLEELK